MIFLKILRKVRRILFGSNTTNNTQFNYTNAEELLKKLRKADVVSFDIFDTIITRKIYSPEDIFTIIEKQLNISDFKKKRIKSDSIARNQLKRDVTIDDIYEILKKDFHIKGTNKIKQYEEQLELDFCLPRKDMLKVFNELKSYGIPIILVSDMYLKPETIKKMLQKCGYKDFSKFYLSNVLNARKDTKTIWDIVKKDFSNKKIIHIGDNLSSDVLYPREFGIDTIQIKSGKTLAKESAISNYIMDSVTDTNDSFFWGTVINEYLFNSPFCTSPQIDDLKDLGFLFYGPILESFFSFIENQTKQNDKLLFLSREGYYLQKLYKAYSDLNQISAHQNYYFLASRKATIFANLKSASDIYKLAKENHYSGSAHNWFNQMLNIDTDFEDFSITLPDDYEKIKPFIDKNATHVIKEAKKSRDNYLLYIRQTIKKLDYNTKIIDLGYSGTIQYELSKMANVDLHGIYLASSEHIKQQTSKNKLDFLYDTRKNPDYKKVYEYSLVLEFFLSAPYGQLINFTKKGAKAIPIYNDETLDTKKATVIKNIEKGIEQYLKCTAQLHSTTPISTPSIDTTFRFYTYCIEQNIISKRVKDKFDFTDNFTTDETKNIFKIISKY